MERMLPEKSALLAIDYWRMYKAHSIAEMRASTLQIVDEMRNEHAQLQAGLNFRQRLARAGHILGCLYMPIDTYTHLRFNKCWRLPSIEPAPRACVLLPRVQHDPNQDKRQEEGLIRLHDVVPSSAYIDVEFPWGLTAFIASGMGCHLNPEALRETYWSSPVILFNVYGPHPRSSRAFLIHVYNKRTSEKAKVKARSGLLIPEFAT